MFFFSFFFSLVYCGFIFSSRTRAPTHPHSHPSLSLSPPPSLAPTILFPFLPHFILLTFPLFLSFPSFLFPSLPPCLHPLFPLSFTSHFLLLSFPPFLLFSVFPFPFSFLPLSLPLFFSPSLLPSLPSYFFPSLPSYFLPSLLPFPLYSFFFIYRVSLPLLSPQPGLGGGDEATSTTQAPAHSDTRGECCMQVMQTFVGTSI